MSADASAERFHAHFQEVVRSQLVSVNQHRTRTMRAIVGWWSVLVPVLLAIGYGLMQLDLSGDAGKFCFSVWFFGLFVALIVPWTKYYDPFRKSFKEELIAPLIRAYRDGMSYAPEGSVERDEFDDSGMFRERSLTNFKGEDRVDGCIGATPFHFSEVDAENVTSSGSGSNKKRHTYPIFRGLFYVAEFNKDFNGTAYVLPDRAQRLLGSVGQMLQSGRSPYGELVKLEDPEFEREFVVYSSGQVEARYILSSAMMQQLHALKMRTKKKLRIGFANSRLYVAIASGKNHFEPRLFREIQRSLFREYWDVLDIFVGIVEELNLNTRIWTKS